MPWEEIAGQERAVRQLRAGLARGRPHHAYLVVGPEGVGKELLARLFAQAANCEAPELSQPCGVCQSCKAIARGNHSEVLWVRPLAEWVARGQVSKADLEAAPSREIRVDEVRQLSRRLSLAVASGRRKVAVLAPADALNERAQNALLKTLEEPPSATTFLLITAHPDVLLPTVRSRCQRVALGPLPLEVIEARLLREGASPAEARARAEGAQGSLGRALDLTGDELQRRKSLAEVVSAALQASDERGALDLAEAHAERNDAQELAQAIREFLHDRLVQFAGEPVRLLAQEALCSKVIDALEQNGNGKLQLERLLLGLRDLGGARG